MRAWSSPCLPLACLLPLTSTLFLAGCGGGGSSMNGVTLAATTLTVSPKIASIAVNGTQIFTATTNAPSNSISWVMVDPGQAGINPGTLTPQPNQTTVLYTAPPTPPLASLQTPGTATVRAIANLTNVDQNFVITAPSISVGFQSNFTTLALGSSTLVYAYAVGSLNNAISLQVNGVPGGSTTVGTIAAPVGGIYGEYNYTAPASMPMTGSTVTITVVSTTDPTKTANLIFTLH
jgi:hypothetical protein